MSDEEPKPDSKGDYGSHTYDGIVENNNPLPGWWQWTLYGAIVFAVVYWFDVQVLHVHPSLREQYDAEAAVRRKAEADDAVAAGAVTADVLIALSKDSSGYAQGREVFASICSACHRADGGGNIGPNLTDAYWLHGRKPETIFKGVREGYATKGMPSWGPQLGAQKTAAVAAYVLSLRDTNVANGKPPQGEKEN